MRFRAPAGRDRRRPGSSVAGIAWTTSIDA